MITNRINLMDRIRLYDKIRTKNNTKNNTNRGTYTLSVGDYVYVYKMYTSRVQMAKEEQTTIRIKKSLNDQLEIKKQALGFKNKEDMIAHLLSLIKTPQEQVKEDIEKLKIHLKSAGVPALIPEVEDLLWEVLENPKVATLRSYLITSHQKKINITINSFNRECNELDIKPEDRDYYYDIFNIKWNE